MPSLICRTTSECKSGFNVQYSHHASVCHNYSKSFPQIQNINCSEKQTTVILLFIANRLITKETLPSVH